MRNNSDNKVSRIFNGDRFKDSVATMVIVSFMITIFTLGCFLLNWLVHDTGKSFSIQFPFWEQINHFINLTNFMYALIAAVIFSIIESEYLFDYSKLDSDELIECTRFSIFYKESISNIGSFIAVWLGVSSAITFIKDFAKNSLSVLINFILYGLGKYYTLFWGAVFILAVYGVYALVCKIRCDRERAATNKAGLSDIKGE